MLKIVHGHGEFKMLLTLILRLEILTKNEAGKKGRRACKNEYNISPRLKGTEKGTVRMKKRRLYT